MAKRLPLPVKRVLRDPFEDHEVAAMVRRASAPRPRRRVAAASAVVVAAIALLAIVTMPRGEVHEARAPLPLRLEGGGPLPALLAGVTRLDDGSIITVEASARLRRLQNDDRDLVLLLERGTARFDVVPGGPRRWTIECGLATVVVVGTRFTIARAEERVVVEVERGAVLVRGEHVPDRARTLGAGERIEVAAPAPIPPPRFEPEREAAPPPEAAAPRATTPARPRWREAAERGAWDDAYAAIGERLESTCERASVDDLFLIADVARLSGHTADAMVPLEHVVRRHRRDPRAALAAFTLGRLAANLGQYERAERAFETALALDVPDALRADALARLAHARRALGDLDGARAVAAQYVVEYPSGREIDAMRRIGTTE
ncbi:FecR domain-containing protein [Sandaracinus amylolyticus]|uniref:FecR protein domain-containing protein n=1 Tax=Sandaracinus amylolyticus TaxID=927083 RepID=A0A0F6W255_9BACT|nr:FecR domain-containing protein [Sandaracinus amylolyticus]AKF05486.1 hypothetical protein DB32_002635 [Sandaracinus amylolyticus]